MGANSCEAETYATVFEQVRRVLSNSHHQDTDPPPSASPPPEAKGDAASHITAVPHIVKRRRREEKKLVLRVLASPLFNLLLITSRQIGGVELFSRSRYIISRFVSNSLYHCNNTVHFTLFKVAYVSICRLKGLSLRLGIAVVVLVICVISLFFSFGFTNSSYSVENIDVDKLWRTADSWGWRSSSAPRSDWPSPPAETNGYLRVRCNGGLNQQSSAICNAVVAARIMNATLVLPELDTNSFWWDESGFPGIYDVEHFIKTLRYDIHIVKSIPEVSSKGKTKKLKAHQIRPPRDAPLSWYTTFALEKMKQHGAIYLTPFSHRLAEEIDEPELQRLRCRVNYHALRFKPYIIEISREIVNRLRSQGHFMSIHLRFEMDMLAFAGCIDIFTPAEQKILIKYRKENFADKKLVYRERRLIGKCPLTPEEVGLILRSMGFDNSTRIYLASGELFGGDRFMKPFRALFPHLENHSTVGPEKLEEIFIVKYETISAFCKFCTRDLRSLGILVPLQSN
ncbi:O-fucosyltransferase family protein [Rhynchospora pubera]|uniref:O-fucosyltransferase family protein n=1 Tax=Rhynchospora pubera TaxID=906938 RepID=A0AAV8CY70_9POAL|nr:O-fucosyltransferase family protein [Rhynchospora pubera]